MKILGCTGGIGSGKSYIVRMLDAMGYPSYDADARAKSLYDTDPALLRRVAEIAGEDIVKDGVLQRKLFASRIFSDRSMLSAVEDAVHPAVLADVGRWKSRLEGCGCGAAVLESALLLEKPLFRGVCDKTVTVSAPMEVRIRRIIKRDGCSESEALARIESQASDGFREKAADFTIFAADDKAILPQLVFVLNKFNQ